jgi:S-formylglutathione hydrolase FrmB
VPVSAAVAPDSPGCVPRAHPPAIGLREVARRQVADRTLELALHSDAMQGDQKVDVLLPRGYDPSGRTRYPVLYLLHGAFGNYHDWVDHGVAGVVGDLPLIVVMPDDGPDGGYSDWYGLRVGESGEPPAWETFHTRELIPYVDATFPTVPSRAGRFVAGLSSGGGGTMKYVAANPGVFGAAGAFSGAVDVNVDYPIYPTVSELLWLVTLIPGYGPDGHCTWGDYATEQVNWLDNDSPYKAENFAGTALYLTTGDGHPGQYDDPAATAPLDPTEYEVERMNRAFVAALDADHIPYTADFYGAGTHTWPYWIGDLQKFLAWLRPYIGHPPAQPASFDYRTSRPAFSAWGWDFAVHRDVREFLYLRDVSPRGLHAKGSGTVDVVTPPGFRGRYLVDGRVVRPDAVGRLHFTVDLGPSHQTQQYQFGDDATAGWVERDVRIEKR